MGTIPRRRGVRAGFGMVVAAILALQVIPGSISAHGGLEPAVTQTSQEALGADLQLIASANGWTLAQAQTRYRSSEALGAVTAVLDAQRPDIFVGGALAEVPEGPPLLYIKGQADYQVKGLVSRAAVPIAIIDDQPYSWRELEARSQQVHKTLWGMGFTHVATWPDITRRGMIHTDVQRTVGLPDTAEAIRAILPADLADDLEVAVFDAPFNQPHHALGGMKTTSASGPNICTAGWSVEGPNGDGVVQADHCNSGINRIGTEDHVMTRRDGFYNGDGDVEYLTTDTAEWAQFYYDDSDTRAVEAVRPASMIQVNDTVCLYGRVSGRHCNLEVHSKGLSCDGAGGFVLMNGSNGLGGDSGGPWYHGTTAYGVHHGECAGGGWDAFSIASRIPDSMPGVTVKTQ